MSVKRPDLHLWGMRMGQKTRFARQLRHDQTDAESCLWAALRNRRLDGCKFRRQVTIGPYVVDFACLSHRLFVELDGGQHASSVREDEARSDFLARGGYLTLRFWNNDVLMQRDAVLQAIAEVLAGRCPHPNPLPPAGEGDKGRSA
jgi:very-short-patch-repair endonuclease